MDFILRPNELQQRFQTTNIQDLVSLERAFVLDPERVATVRAAIEAEVAGRSMSEFTIKDELNVLFQHYPDFYVANQIPDWRAVFHFQIAEVGAYTLTIRDGRATSSQGAVGEPTGVVETDATVLLALLFRERLDDADDDVDEELSDAQLEAVAAGKGACGAEATGTSGCGGDACGGAACGGAACGGAACGGAACLADACGVAACVAAACGGAVAVGGGCGGDACGGAACGGAACGAAGCGGAACGADASGAAGCGGAACGAAAAAGGGCGADACGAAACAIVLTVGDACAADACAIDVIPLIPGI